MTPRIRPRPGVRYRVVVTEITAEDAADDGNDYLDDVVFDHTGDAFIVGVATMTGTRITAEVNHDGRPVPARTPHRLHHQRRTRTLNRPTPTAISILIEMCRGRHAS